TRLMIGCAPCVRIPGGDACYDRPEPPAPEENSMPRTSIGDVGFEIADGVARIILQAPGRGNTLTRATTKAFAQVVDAVLEAGPRVVMLLAEGRIFCAG